MYRDNLALLMERFPSVGLLAFSFSSEIFFCLDALPANWPTPIAEVEVLYLFGLAGRAYEPLKAWLHEKADRKLVFLENEPGSMGSFLYSPLAKPILLDPQVDLYFLPKGKHLDDALQKIAKSYPVQTLDVIALPFRKKGVFWKIRLKLLRYTTLSYGSFLDRAYGDRLFVNFLRNAPHLANSFYVNSLQGVFSNIPALICGAGPSLQSDLEIIRTLENRVLIFAGGSAISALSSAGIQPHFCIAVDPNEEEVVRMKNSFAFEVPFLYSTRLHPDVFCTLNGPYGYLRFQFSDVCELWMKEELQLSDALIGEKLADESLTVTALAASVADWFGCNLILLAGLDMAYTGGKRYASAVGIDEGFKELKSRRTASDRIVLKKGREGKATFSAIRWIMESASLSSYAKACPAIRFINTTKGGIGFKGIDYMPLDQAIQKCTQEYDLKGLVHAASSQGKISTEPNRIAKSIQELQESLKKVVAYLHVLSGNAKGIPALAEIEMQEELAFSVLFHDIGQLLPHMLRNQSPDRKWPVFLELAEKYLTIFLEKKSLF
jgi:hypothetical protein